MVSNLANQPFWMMFSVVLILLLILTIGLVTASFDLRRARLPEATRWDDLNHRVGALALEIQDKTAAIRAMDQKITDRDRIAAEVAALSDQLEALRIAIAGLEEGERQVEALKHRAAEAVEAYAVENAKVVSAQEELRSIEAEVVNRQQRASELQHRLEAIQDELDKLRSELPGDIEDLRKEVDAYQAALVTLKSEISELQSERSALLAAREESSALAVRKSYLEQELASLIAQIDAIRTGHELREYYEERARLLSELEALRAQRATAAEFVGDIEELSSKKSILEEEVLRLRREASSFDSVKTDIEELRRENAALLDKRLEARAEITALEARKAVLERDIAKIEGVDPEQIEDEGVADLTGLPVCLQNSFNRARDAQQESEALDDVSRYLNDIGLQYDRRTIAAFHTALKINETSQMTVLAGVSGTGKSLLPRRYAEAMGIHFLQIAVEPRWDSPQDLLGFYNYIEKRYRGTDLARALVHMDPFDTSGLAGGDFGGHLLLVLLDEMNLARVEYYFSEFLSRLELRPKWIDAQDPTKRVNASLPIEIRGRKQGPIRLFPSSNILFAGTMNDDESTQALSDKVLDRSNVMQFAAPGEFATPIDNKELPTKPGYRTYEAWRKWISTPDALRGGDREKADRTIKQLAAIMESCGRPFGHRLNESMLTYVANYPRQRNDTVAAPLADQVEFRILPKLRGLAIEEHHQSLDDLCKLVREELNDTLFATRLGDVIERQRGGSGQFNWRGLDRYQV